MTRKPMKSARLPLPAAAVLLAALAMLMLAGTVGAHKDGKGHHGEDPAGTIASFDTASGMLVIDLAEGGSVSGLVTSRTWIKDDDHCKGKKAKGEPRRALHGWCRKHLHGFKHGGGKHHGWGHRGRGGMEDLVAGATVEDALVVLKDGRSFFWKVDLDD